MRGQRKYAPSSVLPWVGGGEEGRSLLALGNATYALPPSLMFTISLHCLRLGGRGRPRTEEVFRE